MNDLDVASVYNQYSTRVGRVQAAGRVMVTYDEKTRKQTPYKLFDPHEVKRALDLLIAPGQVVELRALNALTKDSPRTRYTASGYFNDMAALIHAGESILAATGIYITLQPCKRGLLTRANNRLRSAEDMRVDKRTTADGEILSYRWLPIDIDPIRVEGNDSSSTEEHERALTVARCIVATLKLENWPTAVLADSGNGAHILYPVDYPISEASIEHMARRLLNLSNRFSTKEAKVDTGVFNPARIWKLYGTRACKGDSTPEWPHRMSRLLEV